MATNCLVIARPDEPIDGALKRLKNTMLKQGLFKEIQKRNFYEKPSIRKRHKSKVARTKRAKALRRKGEMSESMELQMKERIQQRKGVI